MALTIFVGIAMFILGACYGELAERRSWQSITRYDDPEQVPCRPSDENEVRARLLSMQNSNQSTLIWGRWDASAEISVDANPPIEPPGRDQ